MNYTQGYSGIIGTCFNEIAVVQKGIFRKKYDVSICFNNTGLIITDGDDSIKHGVYLGWSSAEQAFGFTDGKSCRDSVPRAAKVRMGCCTRTAIYATELDDCGTSLLDLCWPGGCFPPPPEPPPSPPPPPPLPPAPPADTTARAAPPLNVSSYGTAPAVRQPCAAVARVPIRY